jgi:SAM-dependent methyltransferase
MERVERWKRRLASFRRRRVDIPVDDDALVLDVGSGDKPHWRADVLVDHYVGAEHGGLRSGRAAAAVDRPLFDADASALPFADHAFDYVVCSHVLEHVPDPAATAAELSRVARAGYVEVPRAASAKILDFPSHVWWCRLDGSTLVFTPKTARAFDPEIEDYIERAGIERRLDQLLDSEFDERVIELHWEDRCVVRVEAPADPTFLAAALAAGTQHHRLEALTSRMLTTAFTFPRRRRARAIRYDDVVKPELRRGDGSILERRVYRVD